jgi:hypothetical protein
MVAKLVLDQLEKTGGALTPLTLPVANATANQYLQNNGSGVMSWSTVTAGGVTNIKHATNNTQASPVEADVSGKSALIVSTSAAAANRICTLPDLSTTGLSTCIITIVANADATSTFSLKVTDLGGAEIWTGYQKNDFVTLCVSNGAWLVLDHKETYYSYRYLTSDYTLVGSADYKLTGWTNVTEIGNTWDNVNNKLVTPTGINGYWNINFSIATSAVDHGVEPRLHLAGSAIQYFQHYSPVDAPSYNSYAHGSANVVGEYYATSTQVVEFYIHNSDTVSNATKGTLASATHFTARFNRVY